MTEIERESQGDLPARDDGGVTGGFGARGKRGGFCLRHCAISSRWLNRSFASPLLLFGRSVGLLGAGASYRASCRGSPSFLHLHTPAPSDPTPFSCLV